MLTKDDFLKQYSASTDEELYKMYVTIDDYTGEAKEAIDLEIQRRGGIDVLKNNVRQKQKIKPRTIFGSIIGGTIASLIGGVLWGLQLIQMHRMFVILGIGIALLSYGIIKFSTKQSKENIIVLIATVISTGAAIFIGQLI